MKIREIASFRDDSGYIYTENRKVYRKIFSTYQSDYEHFMQSGLYATLVQKDYLVAHTEINKDWSEGYKVIEPDMIPFISYPYSWSFSMLKDAAILTLNIQKIALEYGMILKDAATYNVQFVGCKPIFIDTLSFEKYEEGRPWQAYGQFCRHFLATLLLMSYCDLSFNKLLLTNLDGIQLSFAAKLLPLKAKFKFGNYLHLFLHSKVYQKHENTNKSRLPTSEVLVSKQSIFNIIDSLKSTISNTSLKQDASEWNKYYEKDVPNKYFKEKEKLVSLFFLKTNAKKALDLGANDGTFSRLISNGLDYVLSLDIDLNCVENNYQKLKAGKYSNILPLFFDIANPEPGIGWINQERNGMWNRISVDVTLALAIVHHISISNHISFEELSKKLSKHSSFLIIEFVPKTDEKVQRLLLGRKDIFTNYTQEFFERSFCMYFNLLEKELIGDSERILYLFRVKNG